jgi:hypothetical protein
MLTPERSGLLQSQKYKTKKKEFKRKTTTKNKHIKALKLTYLKVKVKSNARKE